MNAVILPHHAERRRDRLLVDGAGRRCAVEHGQRVAHRAVCEAGDQPRRPLGQLDTFACRDVEQTPRDVLRTDAAEVEALTARKNGRRDLVQLGRGEDEQHVLGRLLERFQQRVERADREHMHLVDDEHALFDLRGRIARLVAQVADIVDAVVGRRVDLGHVEHRAVQNAAARGAFVARVAVHRMLAVDRPGENFRAGRLARAARTGEQIRMAESAALKLSAQRVGDMLLSDHVRKGLRPPFAV